MLTLRSKTERRLHWNNPAKSQNEPAQNKNKRVGWSSRSTTLPKRYFFNKTMRQQEQQQSVACAQGKREKADRHWAWEGQGVRFLRDFEANIAHVYSTEGAREVQEDEVAVPGRRENHKETGLNKAESDKNSEPNSTITKMRNLLQRLNSRCELAEESANLKMDRDDERRETEKTE